MIDLDRLWLRTLEDVVNRAAHEVKDSLNGVSLNLEVIRSRSSAAYASAESFSAFAESATEQLDHLSARTEAVLFLARPAREPADVAVTLTHLASLLVPTAKSEGGSLVVEGHATSAPTAAPGQATRLALAAGLLVFAAFGVPQCQDGFFQRLSGRSLENDAFDRALLARLRSLTELRLGR